MTSTGSKTVGNHGSHAHTLAALDTEVTRAKAAEAALLARIEALEAPPVPPPVVPPPTAEYPPLTALAARPVAAIPPLPPLYQPVVIGGIKVTRITEAGIAPGYSKRRATSWDGDYINLDYGRKLLNGRTYQPIAGPYNPPGNATWDRIDLVLYGTSDSKPYLYEYGPFADINTIRRDFGRNVSLGNGEGAVSEDGILAIMDFAGNLCSIDTNTLAPTLWFPSGGTLDNCTMSVDGRWIIGGFTTAGTGPGKGTWAWLRDGTQGRQLTTATEHADAAVSANGRQVWVAAPVGGVTMVMVDIETLARTTILPAGSAFGAGHVARSEAGYVTLSTYAPPSAGTPGSDSVVDLYLDGSGRVRNYGPIFHRAPANDQARQPVAQSMGDGRRLVSSDWGTAGIYTFVLEAA